MSTEYVLGTRAIRILCMHEHVCVKLFVCMGMPIAVRCAHTIPYGYECVLVQFFLLLLLLLGGSVQVNMRVCMFENYVMLSPSN